MDAASSESLKELGREHEAWFQKIRDANQDLRERLITEGIAVYYDDEDDVLTLTVGEPREALTETVTNALALRVDPETLKYAGFEILSVREHMAQSDALFNVFIAAMELAGLQHAAAEPAPDRLARAVGALVAV